MRQAVIATIIIGPALVARAHDFWIEPSAFRPSANSLVKVKLRVGEHFVGEPVIRNAEKFERFVIAGPDGEQPILGQDGADPAGMVRPKKPGTHIIGYCSKSSRIELDPEKFEHYLREEGLDAIITARKERGESAKPGKESYSRCAKSVLRVGDGPSLGFNQALGFELELVPDKDPYTLTGDSALPLVILHRGNPLAGAVIVALNQDEPDKAIAARSDPDGRVRLELARQGVWLIKAVHMVRAPEEGGVDWVSTWASLTFEKR